MKIIYTTSGGHQVPIHYNSGYIETKDVKIDLKFTRQKCDACSSQSYSCPPFSPDWDKLSHKKYLAVFYWWIYLGDWWTKGSKYEHYMTNQLSCILAPMAKKFGYAHEELFGSHYYSTGSCRICKPCRNKLGLPCAHPDKLRFALESLGVMVDNLTVSVGGHKLLWKGRKADGPSYLPKYTTAVIAFETNLNTINTNIILDDWMKNEATKPI